MTPADSIKGTGAEAGATAMAEGADPRAIEAEVAAATTRLLYRSPVAMVINLINAPIVAVVLHGAYPGWALVLWVGLVYAVVGARLVNWRVYHRRPSPPAAARAWARRFALGAAASGVLWGLAGACALTEPPSYYVVFIAFVIGGMAAGAIAQHSVYLPALLGFLIPAVLPLAAVFLAEGTPIAFAMGTMAAVFALALALFGRDLNRSLVRNFRLQAEARFLAAGLAQEIARRETAERELSHLARHDALTGLPNRATFFERLRLEIGRAKRGETRFAVHYVDLDHFKAVNDTFGHNVGDQLLRTIAAQLKQNVRQVDLVARLGGDEFAIVQAGISVPAQAETLAAKLIARLQGPFSIDGNDIGIAASIGIALYEPDIEAADVIVERADLAMYAAKSAGRRRYRFYDAASAAANGKVR